jgi:Uma2 family endonuclease
VSAASIPALLTVADYEKLLERPGGHWELHHGEPVFVTFPKRRHKDLQRRIRKLLEQLCEPNGYVVDTEYPYKPLPEHEVWGADIAVVSDSRHDRITNWLDGSPELVIEVRSRSNTKAELHDKAMTTLAGEDSIEFWIIDPAPQTVTVYNKKSGMHLYTADQAVPLPYFGGQHLFIRDIFSA